MTTLTPILTKFWDDPQSWTLATYEKNEGYQALKKALTMAPADLVAMTRSPACAVAAALASRPA